MNNYQCKHSSSTLTGLGASVVATGLVVSIALGGVMSDRPLEKSIGHGLSLNHYTTQGSSTTFGQYGSVLTGQLASTPETFESSVANFYSTLLSAQEPLGAEFERVLHDNLWDLYES